MVKNKTDLQEISAVTNDTLSLGRMILAQFATCSAIWEGLLS